MKSGITGIVALFVLFVAVIVGYSSVFTVSQTEQVLVVRLGEPVRVVTEPGLNFKAPFIDTVISIDKRILDLENPSQEVIASDQKRLVVDAFARYRIKDALRFYQSIGSIQAANIQLDDAAQRRAAPRARRGRPSSMSCATSAQTLMTRIRDQLDREADGYGIQVVDVRIRRADLPEQNSQAVYQRMQTERQREAAEFRAQGGQKAQEIRSKADREVTVIIADANSTAEQVRGEGDGERNRLFAEAYGKDPDFFSFYRSMKAYENGLRQQRYPLPAAAGLRFLQVLQQLVGQAAGCRGGCAEAVRLLETRQGRSKVSFALARFFRAKWKAVGVKKNARQTQVKPKYGLGADLIGTGAPRPKRTLSGRLQSDEVHSVRRLPHRSGHSVRAGRPAVCGKPGLDAPGHEERAGDAGQHSARGRHRIGGRGSDPDLVCPALIVSFGLKQKIQP